MENTPSNFHQLWRQKVEAQMLLELIARGDVSGDNAKAEAKRLLEEQGYLRRPIRFVATSISTPHG